MTRILVTAPFPIDLMEKISSVSPELEIEQWPLPNNKWPEDKTTDAEICYALSTVPDPDKAPNLRWIQTHTAGVEYLVDLPVWESDIKITTASGIHAPIMAQYVMAQILSWANRVPRWIYYQNRGEWPKGRWEKFLPIELKGKTVGILGYGSIGREVARLAKAFDMKVLATKRNARSITDEGYTIPGSGDKKGTVADRIYPTEATGSMVAKCDFVVIALPLTSTSRHLVDERLLKEMKPECFLVNVGRGPIVKQPDLIKALKKGWIAGAGLDVFEIEPLPAESPLWSMENVIISPHISGFTPLYDERVTDLFTENLRRYLDGRPLLNLVSREAGY